MLGHQPASLASVAWGQYLASAEDAPAGDVLLLTAGSSVERLLLPVGSSPFLSREARPLAEPDVQSRAGGPWTPAPTLPGWAVCPGPELFSLPRPAYVARVGPVPGPELHSTGQVLHK